MEDARPLWMKIATLRFGAVISADYSRRVIQFMHDWLTAIDEASAAEGYHATLINVAIDNLEDELETADQALASGELMPGLLPTELIDDAWLE